MKYCICIAQTCSGILRRIEGSSTLNYKLRQCICYFQGDISFYIQDFSHQQVGYGIGIYLKTTLAWLVIKFDAIDLCFFFRLKSDVRTYCSSYCTIPAYIFLNKDCHGVYTTSICLVALRLCKSRLTILASCLTIDKNSVSPLVCTCLVHILC